MIKMEVWSKYRVPYGPVGQNDEMEVFWVFFFYVAD